MKPLRQLLSWRRLVFLAVLAGIGWFVYHLLPPEPRWTAQLPEACWWDPQLLITPDSKRVLAFAPIQSGSAARAAPVQIRQLSSGKLIAQYGSETDLFTTVVVSPDGRRALRQKSEEPPKLLDLSTGEEYPLKLSARPIFAPRFSACGRFLLVEHDEGGLPSASLFETEAGRLAAPLPDAFSSAGFTNDGKYLHLQASEGSLWDTEQQKVVKLEGKLIESGGRGRYAVTKTGKHDLLVWDLQQPRAPLRRFPSSGTGACEVSPSGRHLLVYDERCSVLDVRNGGTVWEGVLMQSKAGFDSNERYLLLRVDSNEGYLLSAVDLASNKTAWQADISYHWFPWQTGVGNVLETRCEVEFTPDSKLVIVFSEAPRLHVLDAATGESRGHIDCPYLSAWQPKISADSRWLAFQRTGAGGANPDKSSFVQRLAQWVLPNKPTKPAAEQDPAIPSKSMATFSNGALSH